MKSPFCPKKSQQPTLIPIQSQFKPVKSHEISNIVKPYKNNFGPYKNNAEQTNMFVASYPLPLWPNLVDGELFLIHPPSRGEPQGLTDGLLKTLGVRSLVILLSQSKKVIASPEKYEQY